MRFTKGLNKDIDPSAQLESTYRDMTNGIINESVGAVEPENTNDFLTFYDFNQIIGTLTISERDKLIVFTYDSSLVPPISEVLEVDLTNENVSTIVDDSNIDSDTFGFENAEYIDATYNFLSQIERSDQALKWPRVNFYDRNDFFIDGIPNALKDATAELARDYIVNGDLLPSQSRGGDIRKVKAGSVEVEYGEAAPTQRTFNFVNRLLAAFTDGRQGSANMRLSRT